MKKNNKILLLRSSLILLGAAICLSAAYVFLEKNNINENAPKYLYIRTGTSYQKLLNTLDSANILINNSTFDIIAKLKKLPGHVKAGKYRINCGMSNYKLVSKLRSGNQDAVRICFNNIRTLPQFAGRISKKLELDSSEFMQYIQNDSLLSALEQTKESAICLFIPNTYEIWWNSSVNDFMKRMYKEYNFFWNEKRLKKADSIDLTPQEVMTLASIVEEENSKRDEQAKIAGLYINRLKKNMLLQSDPTVKFALGDFEKRRLSYKDLLVNSPYNTYKYKGLPPGPIRMPSINAIDAVLNYEKHDYLYMCAKEDFSGYHNFASSAAEHSINARRYHNALNRNNINIDK